MSADAPRYVRADPRLNFWGTVYGGNSSTSGSSGASDTTSRTYGIVAGADYRLSRDTMLGFALGGGESSFAVSDGLGSGDADMVQTGLFGKHTMGAAYVFAGLSYTYQDVTTNRALTVSGADELEAKFDANIFGGRIEGGYRYATPFVGITPYAALQADADQPARLRRERDLGLERVCPELRRQSHDDHAHRARRALRSRIEGRRRPAHAEKPLRLGARRRQRQRGVGDVPVVAGLSVHGEWRVPSKDLALVSAGAELKWQNDLSIVGTFEGEFSDDTVGYAGKGAVRLGVVIHTLTGFCNATSYSPCGSNAKNANVQEFSFAKSVTARCTP